MSSITVNQSGTVSTASTSDSRSNSISDPLVAATNAAAQEAIAITEAASRVSVATISSGFQVAVANIEAGAATTVETTRANAVTTAASAQANAATGVAQINLQAQTTVASTESASRQAVATTSLTAQTTVASTESAAAQAVESTRANATMTAASTQANAQITAAQTEAGTRVPVAQIQASAQITAANAEANGRVQAATIDGAASRYKADRDLDGVNAHENAETARLNTSLAFANSKFEEILPLVTGVVGSGSGSGSGGSSGFRASTRPGPIGFAPGIRASATPETTAMGNEGYGFYSLTMRNDPMRMGSGDAKTGGIGFATGTTVADATAATQLPFISTSGVLTPAQVQQQVNAATARGDARTQADIRKLFGDMAGRGFSSNSPILAALQVSLSGQNLKASLAAETQIRLEAAKLNADAVFAGQKAVSDQFIQQEQVLLEGDKNTITRQVGILSAVAQMVSAAL